MKGEPMKKKYYLHDSWKFRISSLHVPAEPNELSQQNNLKYDHWYEASVPGTIHTDLMKNKIIEEPFYADNEQRLQWVGREDWTYRTVFNMPPGFSTSKPALLVFDGIDTVAEVNLNGIVLGKTNNMFRSYRFDVTGAIKTENNELTISFTSAHKYARMLESQHGRLPVALNSERVYIRKAQYSFGWDWGPSFITLGLWRPVYILQSERAELGSILFDTTAITKNSASVLINTAVKNENNLPLKLKIKLSDGRQSFEKETNAESGGQISSRLKIQNPRLWFPSGSGRPFLYDMTVQLIDVQGQVLDEKQKKVGIRSISLRQNKTSEEGNTVHVENDFCFIVNNEQVYVKGANWIPSDSFLTRTDRQKYRRLLEYARDCGMNMIRVWGGGIYENDEFYELCDELGLMVWQDFMFACAAYPEVPDLLDNIKAEVEENIFRLQYHASLAIWCGNNENEWIWFQEQSQSVFKMPGFKIYHEIIPRILRKLDRSRSYVPSTPYGMQEDPNSPLSGNRHQWDIWSKWIDYKTVQHDESLFVSEFGFQSPANYSTLKKALPKKERTTQSYLFEYHNKQVEGNERLFRFLAGHLPVQTSLKDFIYLCQLNHGLAMKECLDHWRLRYPLTNGSIIWQLNDLWPVSSWALVDSDMIPKLPYYFVRRAFAPVMGGFIKRNSFLEAMLVNDSLEVFSGTYEIKAVSLPKGKCRTVGQDVIRLQPSERKHLPELFTDKEISLQNSVIILSLYDHHKMLSYRNFYLQGEWKHLKMPQPDVSFSMSEEESGEFTISVNKPAFFVTFYKAGAVFSDNGFILLPDEEYRFNIKGSRSQGKLNMYCLNDYL